MACPVHASGKGPDMATVSTSSKPIPKTFTEGQLPARGASLRSILIGMLLIPLNCFWVIRMERVAYGPYPSTISLFANVVFLLFLLVGLNAVLRRWLPRLAFSQAELLIIYTMLAVSTGLAGLDGVSALCQVIPHGVWFSTPANGWNGFLNSFPSWLVIRDKSVLAGHYQGNSSFYQPDVLRAWIVPILAWTGFVTALLFVAQCINVLVRPQWADREKLTFPIVWLPLEMTEEGTGSTFFRNRLMWLGFAIAAGMSFWNGLTVFFPTWPAIPLGIKDLRPLLTAKPWTAIDWFPITLYPIVLGLAFLLPVDLLFSCVFFFLFWNAQVVVSSAAAWDTMPDFPFTTEQGFGSIIGLFLFYVWSGRDHYRAIWREAWRPPPASAQDSEALSARSALAGIGLGLIGLLVFGGLAGVSLWVMGLFLLIYLMTVSVVARIRAEFGAPVHDFHFMGGSNMIPRIFGTISLRQPDMAFLTLAYALNRAHRADTMPIGLEGLQMAHLRRFEARRMFQAVMIATVIGCLATFWAYEHQAYQFGASAHFNAGVGAAQEAYNHMEGWAHGTLSIVPNHAATLAIGIGLVCTLLLCVFRLRFLGFPLHPIGYAVSSSWAIHLIWFPLLIAWVLKSLTLRYGGLRMYRQALPFFLGLVLGDCVMGSLWGLVGLVMNVHTYNFFGA